MKVKRDDRAADRRDEARYPDFVLGALVLALLIAVIGLGYAFGIVR